MEFEIRTASLSRRFQFNQSIRGVASIGAAAAAAATWFNKRPLDGAEVDIPMNWFRWQRCTVQFGWLTADFSLKIICFVCFHRFFNYYLIILSICINCSVADFVNCMIWWSQLIFSFVFTDFNLLICINCSDANFHIPIGHAFCYT